MNCRRYQRLLHLNGVDELSPREQTRLSRHLQTCMRCTADLRRIRRADELRLASTPPPPHLPDPDEFTKTVMARVRQDSAYSPQRKWTASLDRLFDLMGAQRARLATAIIILITVGSFLAQEFTFLNDIRSLERKMTLPFNRTDATVSFYVPGEVMREHPELRRLQQHDANVKWATGGESMIVSDQALKSLFGQFRSSPFGLLQLQSVLGMERSQSFLLLGRLAPALSVRIQIPLERK